MDGNDYSGVVVLTREEFPAADAQETPASTYRPPEPVQTPPPDKPPACPAGYNCGCGTPVPVEEVRGKAACR